MKKLGLYPNSSCIRLEYEEIVLYQVQLRLWVLKFALFLSCFSSLTIAMSPTGPANLNL